MGGVAVSPWAFAVQVRCDSGATVRARGRGERRADDIASASKQFTAACVLMLAHEGKLSLDDDIRKHVPELALESEVTIGQCLNLAPWFGFLADGRVLGTRLRDALLERGVLADGTVLSYAHGIFHWKVGELDAFGHTGGMHGYVSNLLYLPGPDLGVAVLTNQSALDPVGLSRRLALELTGQREDSENVARGRAPAPVVGHWYEEATDTPITVAEAGEGRVAIVQQEAEFAPGADGRWYGVGEARTTWLAVEDGTLIVGSTPRDEPPMIFTPCRAPGEDRAPDGAWLSDEYDVLAVLKDGRFTMGLTLELDTEPAPAGAWRAGPFTLRVEPGGDLTISGEGFRRMRFTAQPEGTTPVGIPPGLVQMINSKGCLRRVWGWAVRRRGRLRGA
ncbi:serine hydrolase [Microtetraspora malaysiensis]|uniref:serine hydrolase n=1 Tax=Microtetraspora malaysiensis TaxID=161358 RepID=UPI003D905CFE